VKLSEVGLREMDGALETTNDTLTTCEVAPLAAMITVPV
jgi:hypothetical protein